MTQSSTNTSSVLDYCWYEYASTVASIDDLLSTWLWDPPTALPTMYVQKPMIPVIEPHIEPHIETRSYKQFLGHKFRLGGSKK